MAARKTTRRRKTTARRRPARRSSTRRRTTRRRRRNPSMDAKGTAKAAAGGAMVAAAAFALEGADLKPEVKLAAAAIAGLAVGYMASAYDKPVGAGLAGAGVALAVKGGLDMYKAKQAQTAGMGAIMPGSPHVVAQMAAVRAPLGLGAVRAPLAGAHNELHVQQA